MKAIKILKSKKAVLIGIAVMVSFLFTSCTKDTADEISGGTTGSIVFWSNQAGSSITVKVNGGSYSGTISKYINGSAAPGCGEAGSYTVSLSTGTTYSYTATDGSHKWSGTFSLGTGCKSLLLYW